MKRVIRSKKEYENTRQLQKKQQLDKHNEYLEILDTFNKNDSKLFPGKLLLHFDKKCTCIDSTDQEKIDWLTQYKYLEKYKDMYSRIYKTSKLNILEQKIKDLKTSVGNEIDSLLTPKQECVYYDVLQLIKDYKESSTRTKKSKELYNCIVELLGGIVKVSGIHLHIFLGFSYALGSIQSKDTILTVALNDNIRRITELQDSIDLEQLYIKNTFRNLDKELFTFIQRPKVIVSKYTGINWSKLDLEQQHDCFEKYSRTFCEKYSIPLQNDTLYTKLVDSYKQKTLVYRCIKWDKSKGQITEIRGLSFDNNVGVFVIKKIKTSSSIRSCVVLDQIKLNNAILDYILGQKKKYNKLDDIQFDKTHFFQYIKTIFEVTLPKDLKLDIWNKLNIIYNCILERNDQ